MTYIRKMYIFKTRIGNKVALIQIRMLKSKTIFISSVAGSCKNCCVYHSRAFVTEKTCTFLFPCNMQKLLKFRCQPFSVIKNSLDCRIAVKLKLKLLATDNFYFRRRHAFNMIKQNEWHCAPIKGNIWFKRKEIFLTWAKLFVKSSHVRYSPV